MSSNYEIVVLHRQIMHRHSREIELQRLPVIAVINGEEDTSSVPAKSRPLRTGCLSNGANISAIRNTRINARPCFAEIVRAINPCADIVHAVAINGGVGCGSSKMTRINKADFAPDRQTGRCNVRPGFATIAREVNEASVAARPYFSSGN